jgi:hypothetical protein
MALRESQLFFGVGRSLWAAGAAACRGEPTRHRLMRLGAALSMLLIAGCNHSIASKTQVDVCALALDAVAAVLDEAPIATPSQGACLFQAAGRSRIHVTLLTRASAGGSDHLDHALRTSMAEAEATYGHAASREFGDLAEVAVAFGPSPPESLNQVVVAERGVLMEISIGGGAQLSHDDVVALTRKLWERVTHYKSPSA